VVIQTGDAVSRLYRFATDSSRRKPSALKAIEFLCGRNRREKRRWISGRFQFFPAEIHPQTRLLQW